ncbi:MAG TPA: hypothetical protein VLG50_07960 [Candidatus Saccharimonadales bacterium]|nr:hypothetical protein [Candidatus Saccharimonadales bacterium]
MASYAVTTITTSGDLNTHIELFLIDATNGSINCHLPTITTDGNSYFFKRTDSNILSTVTLTADKGNTINNNATHNITLNDGIRIVSYDTNYIIL